MSNDNAEMTQVLPILQNLMENLLSPNNEIRTQAEKTLNTEWSIAQPKSLLIGLSLIMNESPDPNIRGFASVLLRRVSLKEDFNSNGNQDYPDTSVWVRVNDESRNQVKSLLLSALNRETDSGSRNKICDTISDIANYDDKWPELLGTLFICASSEIPSHRESAYRIFYGCPQLLADQNPQSVRDAFIGAFQDPVNNVRLAALKAAVQVLMISQDKYRSKFDSMVPHMLSVLEPLVSLNDEQSLVECLSALSELAEVYPKAFRPILVNMLDLGALIGGNKNLMDATRQVALEVLITLAEAAPGLCRKQSHFCEKLVPVILDMMTEIQDDEDWYAVDSLDEDDEEDNSVFGEQAIDRLACSLGGKQMLPVAFQHIPTMLSSQEWQRRHAALMAISAIGEGSFKIMKNELENILNIVCPYIRDPHPRIRYAACNAIGQISTDFSPTVQEKFHSIVLQSLIPAMDDVSNPRVQAHAAAAMVNFCEEARKKTIEPYLDTLFERLMKLLTSDKRYVQEQAITTIATVADSAQELFRKHYSAIVPQLLNVLENASEKEYRLLRGKAIECASFIALAVGYDVFKTDAPKFIDLLVKTQSQVVEDDDPQISYLLAAWARLCKVMGQDFIPYLPVVMPPLLKSASLQPDFAILDSEEDASIKYASEDGWEFATISGQQIGIRTSVLEEKCTAVEMLICYSRELGAGFEPYAKTVLDLILPMLKFYFHEGVKFASTAAIAPILESMKSSITLDAANSNAAATSAKSQEFVNSWNRVCDILLKSISNETDDPPFVSQLFSSFADSVEVAGEGCLNNVQLQEFISVVNRILNLNLKQIEERQIQFNSGEGVDEEEARIIGEDEIAESEAMDSISKALRLVLKTNTSSFIGLFDQLIPTLVMFADPKLNSSENRDNDSYALQWFICVFDDFVEITGPSSWTYSQYFLSIMVQSLDLHNRADVRQAAAFGIGICAQFGGPVYSDAVAQALPSLAQMITSKEGKAEENIYATENAISALVKILMYNSGSLANVEDALVLMFSGLPVLYDEDEAQVVYNYLLQVLGDSNLLLSILQKYTLQQKQNLGQNVYLSGESVLISSAQIEYLVSLPNGLGLLHLVNVLVDVLSAEILDAELCTKLASILQGLLQNCPDETKAVLWASIGAEKQQSLRLLGYA
ncbi:Importin subunit beta-3 [Smittium mucronatum]|uniref:Importin subunit beta-3 n=1 Tax=Smittium mucronatum TaxID=133383 RepID=A0A1R0GLK8_9FUNG|nr:Importin subunit beta-3 [Smittium mucronatum]